MDPIDAEDDGDGADASDAGDPRLILGSHRALDAIGGLGHLRRAPRGGVHGPRLCRPPRHRRDACSMA